MDNYWNLDGDNYSPEDGDTGHDWYISDYGDIIEAWYDSDGGYHTQNHGETYTSEEEECMECECDDFWCDDPDPCPYGETDDCGDCDTDGSGCIDPDSCLSGIYDDCGVCDGDNFSGCNDSNETCTEANKTTWYKDGDGDGFGDDSDTVRACDQPDGYVNKGGDCDDTKFSADNNCCPEKHILVNETCIDPCDFVRAAADVYDTEGNLKEENYSDNTTLKNGIGNGWELAKTSDLVINDSDFRYSHISGFNSALYYRELNGRKQYMYVTEGTAGLSDIDDNTGQIFGTSSQYYQSVSNARILDELVKGVGGDLFFSGHSLGGGMASANAMATGNLAFTYNAAGISKATILTLGLNEDYESNISATINLGDILNEFQRLVGLEANGIKEYVDGEDSSQVEFYNNLYYKYKALWQESIVNVNFIDYYNFKTKYTKNNVLRLYFSGRAHTVASIIEAMNCNE